MSSRPAAASNRRAVAEYAESFASASSLVDRFPTALLAHPQAHEAPRSFIDQELGREGAAPVGQDGLAQRPGVMNEFKYLAEVHAKLDDESVLLARSMRLATPCGPLCERHISPDRELAALISSTAAAAFLARDGGRTLESYRADPRQSLPVVPTGASSDTHGTIPPLRVRDRRLGTDEQR